LAFVIIKLTDLGWNSNSFSTSQNQEISKISASPCNERNYANS